MKRLICILCLMLLASPALAAPRYLGTWVFGTESDNVRTLRLKVRDASGVEMVYDGMAWMRLW